MSLTKKAAAKLDKYLRQEKEVPAQDGAEPTQGAEMPAGADTAVVLEAIAACQPSLTTKIEEVKMDISLIRQDMQKLRGRVTDTALLRTPFLLYSTLLTGSSYK